MGIHNSKFLLIQPTASCSLTRMPLSRYLLMIEMLPSPRNLLLLSQRFECLLIHAFSQLSTHLTIDNGVSMISPPPSSHLLTRTPPSNRLLVQTPN
jgi:hypothetical protein